LVVIRKPWGLAYWISDDGGWDKKYRRVVLSTNDFTTEAVDLLVKVLNDKFDLKCYRNKQGRNYRIIIPSYSILVLLFL
jgi:hypothetical protein